MNSRSSPFQRKGFRLLSNPTFLDYNSDSEAKKPQKKEPIVPYRWLYFSPTLNYEKFKKHLLMVHKGLVYSTKSLKSPSEKFISSKQVTIPDPPQSTYSHNLHQPFNSLNIEKLKTLILDLDETLIHACSPKDCPDVILQAGDSYSDMLKVKATVLFHYL